MANNSGETGEQGKTVTPPFSRHPGRISHGVIDFSSKPGWNHWKMATEKLQGDLYDCKPDGFYQFMKRLKARACLFGWSGDGGILSIAPDACKPNVKKDLLKDYGVFSYERIAEHEVTYINKDTRAAQDNIMLYNCLMNSLSMTGMAKLNIHDKQYILGNPPSEAGLSLLKVLIRESHLDSNATPTMIRTKLSNLDDYLEEADNDVEEFNRYVQMLIDSLSARGETTHDLMTNLFKAYAACSDAIFVRYIADIQTKWEDGEDLNATELMERAHRKFKTLKTKKIWKAPSAEEEKLLALQVQMNDLNKKYELKKKKLQRIKKRRSVAGDDDKNPRDKKKPKKEKPSWFTKRPKDADLYKPREWNGFMWHYCSKETGGNCDGVYRIHKPADCVSKKKVPGKDKDGSKKGKGGKTKDVIIKETLAKLQSDEDDDESDTDASTSSSGEDNE